MEDDKNRDIPVPGFTDELGNRISQLYEAVGGQGVAADLVEATSETLGKWKRGRARMPFLAALKLVEEAGLSLDWLARGDRADFSLEESTEAFGFDRGFVMIPRYDVEASAGPGSFADSESVVDYMAFKEEFVRRTLRADPSKLVLISAVGDSMVPTISPGDLLLIDRSVDRIIDDAIYVLVKRGELVVKRVQQFFNGAVAVKSDNSAYVEETLGPDDADQIVVAGRVRWIGRLI